MAVLVNSFPVLSESFIFNKVMGLRKRGFVVTVLVHDRRNDYSFFAKRLGNEHPDFVHYSLTVDGPVHGLPRLIGLMAKYPRRTTQLWQEARKRYGMGYRALRASILAMPLVLGKYDIIHFAYTGGAVTYLDALPLLHGSKLITSCRGAAEQIKPLCQPERKVRLQEVFTHMDRVHCVSADMQRTVQNYGLNSTKAFINHPAIDPEQFCRRMPYPHKERGPYQLLSVGRLHWKKGLEYGLLAMRQLLDDGYDVYYDIIGSGIEAEHLRFTIHDLDLEQRVQLRGSQPADVIRDALEATDVYLLPSLSEGLSNAALEAMAMEVPLVSTTAGGMAEAVRDGCEGFLVPPRHPSALADQIERLLNDCTLRRRMGQQGRRRIEEHFNLEQQIDRFAQEYQAIADVDTVVVH